MSREILMPLSVDAQGRISTTPDTTVAAGQHLSSYLLTLPGERVMRPAFGTQLGAQVFESMDPVQYELLKARVVDKVNADVRDVRLIDVAPKANYEEATLEVSVEFAPIVGTGQGAARSTTLNLGGTA